MTFHRLKQFKRNFLTLYPFEISGKQPATSCQMKKKKKLYKRVQEGHQAAPVEGGDKNDYYVYVLLLFLSLVV